MFCTILGNLRDKYKFHYNLHLCGPPFNHLHRVIELGLEMISTCPYAATPLKAT